MVFLVSPFKLSAVGNLRAHARKLYATCPFTFDFKSVTGEFGYATAILRTSTPGGKRI